MDELRTGRIYSLIRKYVEFYGVMPWMVECSPDMYDEALAEINKIPLDDRPKLAIDNRLPEGAVNMPRAMQRND